MSYQPKRHSQAQRAARNRLLRSEISHVANYSTLCQHITLVVDICMLVRVANFSTLCQNIPLVQDFCTLVRVANHSTLCQHITLVQDFCTLVRRY
jgi:hypothetical protein